MVRRIRGPMKNTIIFLSSCLLLTAFQVYADRPAMQDRPVAQTPVADMFKQTPEPPPSVVETPAQQTMQQQTATVINLPPKEMQPGETLNIKLLDFPKRGMSMDKVRNELGNPVSISNTVGVPPITHWSYSDRVVYFEHSYVIHVVPR